MPLNYNHVNFIVKQFSDITEKIIPFFDKYKIVGIKSQDYQDFKKVAELMKNKAHLTSEGFDLICKIKEGMNKGRQ
jgi:predicted GTPase